MPRFVADYQAVSGLTASRWAMFRAAPDRSRFIGSIEERCQSLIYLIVVGFHGLGSVAELHHYKELSRRPKREIEKG